MVSFFPIDVIHLFLLNYQHVDFCFRDVRVLNSPIISLTMGRRVSTLKTRGFLSSIPLVRAIPEERLAEPITIYFEHKPGPNATLTTGANAVCVLWVTFLLMSTSSAKNDLPSLHPYTLAHGCLRLVLTSYSFYNMNILCVRKQSSQTILISSLFSSANC